MISKKFDRFFFWGGGYKQTFITSRIKKIKVPGWFAAILYLKLSLGMVFICPIGNNRSMILRTCLV